MIREPRSPWRDGRFRAPRSTISADDSRPQCRPRRNPPVVSGLAMRAPRLARTLPERRPRQPRGQLCPLPSAHAHALRRRLDSARMAGVVRGIGRQPGAASRGHGGVGGHGVHHPRAVRHHRDHRPHAHQIRPRTGRVACREGDRRRRSLVSRVFRARRRQRSRFAANPGGPRATLSV